MTPDPLVLSRVHPELSARTPITVAQKWVLAGGALLLLAALVWQPVGAARAFILLSTLFYLFHTLYKFLLVRYSVTGTAALTVTPAEIATLRDADLPVYSILVPMYQEPESVGQLVDAVRRLDYPAAKLDVQLLLEEDDAVTRDAAAAVVLPPGFRVTVVPQSFPRTKPKACNVGLSLAHGSYLVIYDAEDKPEPDQLKKAVAGFARSPATVVCLQAKLNFYNPRQNLLTKLFTAEYSAWFDLSLPGLSAIHAVIPLGGTSNHFVTDRLRELLGWDAYNVTEDCDLGVRIYRHGWSSQMFNSTTWEEACGHWSYWIRQRTRWIKGYIQTYMVHMRNPGRLLRDLGVANFLHFQLLIGGIVVSFLINPLFWTLAALWFVFRLELLTHLFPGLVFIMAAFCLFAGNFVFAYVNAIGCYERRYFDLVRYCLLSPAYWVLMSYSGWRAFGQFFANPFHWEKTRHGLFKTPKP
jgi:cellulose synthase/poly-beta-1,6-N-acetylglucosamine synthase-like glycosyltransferase